jgi:8-oxo-dGTP diphosphatase
MKKVSNNIDMGSLNRRSYIESCQAFIQIGESYLMQLRDFKPSIIFPGHWGFFGGHCENDEIPLDGMWRELQEELTWQPGSMRELGSLILADNRRVHAHYCQLNVDLSQLTLQEGQEIGIFSVDEILGGKLFSKKWKKIFPISPISETTFKHFILK